jgi:hypothetical protein
MNRTEHKHILYLEDTDYKIINSAKTCVHNYEQEYKQCEWSIGHTNKQSKYTINIAYVNLDKFNI